MCGIIGYVGTRPCRDILFQGLRKLEYRGYDSAGLSIVRDGRFELLHSVGNLDNLEEILYRVGTEGTMGIAHTRWATHGRPSAENAHPHTDCNERFAIVLNGIVENYLGLRAMLQERGHRFTSETDAEVVAHLIEEAYDGSLREATVAAYRQMEGHFTYCAIAAFAQGYVICGLAYFSYCISHRNTIGHTHHEANNQHRITIPRRIPRRRPR